MLRSASIATSDDSAMLRQASSVQFDAMLIPMGMEVRERPLTKRLFSARLRQHGDLEDHRYLVSITFFADTSSSQLASANLSGKACL